MEQAYVVTALKNKSVTKIIYLTCNTIHADVVDISCFAEQHAQVTLYIIILDSVQVFLCTNQAHEQSSVKVHIMYAGNQHDQIVLTTRQEHYASHTSSELTVAGILAGSAQCHYTGTIFIAKKCKQVSGDQQNKNMLLHSGARVFAKPTIEVFSDDVACSHGSATSFIDEQAQYILATRGIAAKDAQSLLIDAFIRQYLSDGRFAEIRSSMKKKVGIYGGV